MEPCWWDNAGQMPVIVFLVVAVLSHARGTALLMREALSWFERRRERRRRRRTP